VNTVLRVLILFAFIFATAAFIVSGVSYDKHVTNGINGRNGINGTNANACQEIASMVNQLNLEIGTQYGTLQIPSQCIGGQ
jgi:hypothetical protein